MKAIKYFLIALFACLAFSCAEESILGDGDDDDDPIIVGGGNGTGQPGGGSGSGSGGSGSGGAGSGGSGGGGRLPADDQVPQDSVFRVKF